MAISVKEFIDVDPMATLVYDPDLLAWVRMTQPLIDAGTVVVGSVDQGSAGASAWLVDGSGVTQPISAASLPLPSGAATNSEVGNYYTSAYDYDGSNNLIYSGRAVGGSSKASNVWQIKKYTYSGSNLTDIQWAGGDQEYDNIWNDRVSLSYS